MKNVLITILTLCFLGVAYYFYENKTAELNEKLLISEQNYKAKTDSLHTDLKNKDQDIIYMKSMYLAEIDDLNSKITNLKVDNKNLQLKLKNYIKLSSEIKHDTIYTKTKTIETDSIINIHFNYLDEWTTLEGYTNYYKYNKNNTNTKISTLNINAPLEIGITDDYNIVVTSKNPNLKITEITGVTTIEKKKKRKIDFNHGLQIGFGGQYGLIHKEFDIGPSINYGIEIWF